MERELYDISNATIYPSFGARNRKLSLYENYRRAALRDSLFINYVTLIYSRLLHTLSRLETPWKIRLLPERRDVTRRIPPTCMQQ